MWPRDNQHNNSQIYLAFYVSRMVDLHNVGKHENLFCVIIYWASVSNNLSMIWVNEIITRRGNADLSHKSVTHASSRSLRADASGRDRRTVWPTSGWPAVRHHKTTLIKHEEKKTHFTTTVPLAYQVKTHILICCHSDSLFNWFVSPVPCLVSLCIYSPRFELFLVRSRLFSVGCVSLHAFILLHSCVFLIISFELLIKVTAARSCLNSSFLKPTVAALQIDKSFIFITIFV